MARVLIVGCGCRGRSLGRELVSRGHAVRGTTRDPERAAEIAAAGAEPWIGDPGRLATLTGALDSVTVVCWLLASARGGRREVAALHDERLAAYLREMVDTTVRGFVYEAAGDVERAALDAGRAVTARAEKTWSIPVALLDSEPAEHDRWTSDALAATASLLAQTWRYTRSQESRQER